MPWFVACCARCPGLRHPVAVVAWHLPLCFGCGLQRASLACLVAPRWCAAPRPVRLLSVLQLAFRTPWCLSPGWGLAPPALLGGCAAHAEAGRELCLPLAPAKARALGSLRIVPVRGPAMEFSLAGPPGVGLGLRALRFFGCVDPFTDASGFPYRPSFDRGLGRCTGAVSCGRRYRPFGVRRRHARVPCVCACACFLGRAGRAGLPGAFWCASLFPVAVVVALFVCSAPSGLGLPCLCCFWVFFFSPLVRPPCLSRSVSSGPGCLGPWCLVVLPPPSFVFFSSSLPPACLSFLWVFFPFFVFVPCWLCGARWVCPGLWGVLVCDVVGLVLRRGPVCACALLFGAPCLCLPLFCCCLLCCVCRVAPCWRRCSSPCCLWWRPCGVARPTPQALGAGGFFFASGLCWLCPPLQRLVVLSCVVVCPASCGGVLRSVVCFVLCPLLCGVLVFLRRVVLGCVVLLLLCFAFVRCCVLRWFVFFCVVPCLSVVLRSVSVSVLCLCGAELVCLRRCSLCAALLPLRRWLVICVVVCSVCLFAVGPGCPLLSPGWSWWLLMSCFCGVLWCVPRSRAAPRCCALCRQALCGFVLLCLGLSCGVSCPGALSVVLGSCALRHCVLSCLAALCLFCCGVLLRGVIRRCALCRVRPAVSCCALPVLSSQCGVAVGPCSPLVSCSPVLCPVVLCCRVVLWCPVLLLCLICFLPLFGFSYLKNSCKIC